MKHDWLYYIGHDATICLNCGQYKNYPAEDFPFNSYTNCSFNYEKLISTHKWLFKSHKKIALPLNNDATRNADLDMWIYKCLNCNVTGWTYNPDQLKPTLLDHGESLPCNDRIIKNIIM